MPIYNFRPKCYLQSKFFPYASYRCLLTAALTLRVLLLPQSCSKDTLQIKREHRKYRGQ